MRPTHRPNVMSLFLVTPLVLAILAAPAAADLNDYGLAADPLQDTAFSRFLSADGLYYVQDNGGNTGFNYWWMAHGLDSLIDAYQRTRNATYLTRAKNLLHGARTRNGNTFNNSFYDDMEWMGLATLRAYDITGDTEYLTAADGLWTQIKTGFSGGLISWNTSCHPSCKNTIGNTPAIILGARLSARGRISAADLTMIETMYGNVKASLVDPATGAVWDGKDLSTGTTNKSTFSYNQGMYIGAALELYKITGNATYMADAKKTADRALTSNTVSGMLYANETGGGDGGLFKGILVRYLALLAREGAIPDADRTRYIAAIKHNANVLHGRGVLRPAMLAGPNWSVVSGAVTDYSTQLSGVFLEEAAAIIDDPVVYRDFNYAGAWSSLPPGRYTIAQLAARGVRDNDITSITVPPGWTVTMFENDNFTGASLVRTANDNFLSGGAWTDRVSSLIVTAPAAAATALTAYQNCNFTGYSVSLLPGSYDMFALQDQGIPNDDISSFQLAAGNRVTLFGDFNLTGTSLVATATDSCLVDNAFNDSASSLRIDAAP